MGQESARTYWVRRGILLAVALLLVLGVVLAVANLTKSAVASAPPPAVLPADTPTPSVPTPSVPATPSAASPAPASASPTAGSASGPATPIRSASPAQPSTPASGSAAAKPSTTASAQPKPRPTTTTVGTPDCKPADLRVALKGDRNLAAGKTNRFTLSLINGGAQTCLASVTDRSFELKIYSGKDRIWSSRDCTKVLADFDKKLASKAAVNWSMVWNGKRSAKGGTCDYAAAKPQPGTYWATAQLRGAEPVQLRMILG